MGQVQFGRCSRKLPKKVLATPRGNFENSTNYHVSFEALYGICSPRDDIVKVIRTRYNYTARWISRCPLPTLGGYGKTREIALKHYKILQSYRVELVIDSAIGTLFFNSDYPRDSGEFNFDIEEDFLKSLRHQAIYETPFSIWNNATYEQIFWCLSCLMMGLERLMLRIEIFRYGDPLNPAEPRVRERWMGWEFGGGVPTWE